LEGSWANIEATWVQIAVMTTGIITMEYHASARRCSIDTNKTLCVEEDVDSEGRNV